MTKAILHLFAGEPNAKRYRVVLDEMIGLPKKFPKELKQNPNVVQSSYFPLSELIMGIAPTQLSKEVLYRSPTESFDKLLWERNMQSKTELRSMPLYLVVALREMMTKMKGRV